MVQCHVARRGISIEDLGVAPAVVGVWASGVVKGLAERLDAEPAPHWPEDSRFPLLAGEAGGRQVSLTLLPIGAPGTIAVLENLELPALPDLPDMPELPELPELPALPELPVPRAPDGARGLRVV